MRPIHALRPRRESRAHPAPHIEAQHEVFPAVAPHLSSGRNLVRIVRTFEPFPEPILLPPDTVLRADAAMVGIQKLHENPSIDNHSVPRQQSSPCNDPLLFVIPSGATCPGVPWRNLQCAIRVPHSCRCTTIIPPARAWCGALWRCRRGRAHLGSAQRGQVRGHSLAVARRSFISGGNLVRIVRTFKPFLPNPFSCRLTLLDFGGLRGVVNLGDSIPTVCYVSLNPARAGWGVTRPGLALVQ